MKKGLLAALVLTFSFVSLAPVGSADAHHYHKYRSNWRERVCERFERREIRAWHRYDENRDRTVKRIQRQIDRQERFNCMPDGTIVEQLGERGQFNTLAAALTEANLVDTLNGDGDFTVFAPTDAAFAKLGQDTIDAVLADINLLTNILTYHVVDPAQVPTAVPSDVAVTLSSAPMFNGQTVDIEVRGGALFINDSQVIMTNVQATNGIVHVIDMVLMP